MKERKNAREGRRRSMVDEGKKERQKGGNIGERRGRK